MPDLLPSIAQVVFSLSLDRDFDYLIPPHLLGRVRVGSRVRVPFRNSERSGFVVALKPHSDFPPEQLKAIGAIEDSHGQIPDNLIWLAGWIADDYCCPREHAVRAMLPAVVRSGEMKHKQALFVSLTPKATQPSEELAKFSEQRKAIIAYLQREGARPLAELIAAGVGTAAVIAKLCEIGWLQKDLRVVERDPFMDDVLVPDAPKKLTPDQSKALDAISQALDGPGGQVILLHGVTASGKTEVYLQAIAHCLELGRDAIVLVPEISLTPPLLFGIVKLT